MFTFFLPKTSLVSVGPFVVNYDSHNWFLLSQKVGGLPEKIRIQLLHDSLKLAMSSKLGYITALNMTLFLRYEKAPAVWKTFYPLADQFRKLLDGSDVAKPFDVRKSAFLSMRAWSIRLIFV